MKLIVMLVISFVILADVPVQAGRGCSGSSPCTACKNCSRCKHCAKEGGTCGVCKPVTTKAKKKSQAPEKSNTSTGKKVK